MPGHFFETAIAAHARREAPREACGLVLRDRSSRGGFRAHECRNAAEDPLKHFAIEPTEWLPFQQAGTLVGYYHSHVGTSPEPSPADKHVSEEAGLPCWIYSLRDDVLTCYRPSGYFTPLEGRPFVPLVLDCVALVWDYWRQRGVELPFLPRTQAEYATGLKMDWRPLLEQTGARFVTIPQKGDILLMGLYGQGAPNHMGVYIGDGHFLHQPADQPSQRAVWTGQWRLATQFIVRLPHAATAAANGGAL